SPACSTSRRGSGSRPTTGRPRSRRSSSDRGNDQLSANRRKALVIVARLFAIWFVVFLIVALLLGGGVMLMLPIVIAVAATVAAYSASDAVPLRLAHAVRADEVKHARFRNLVEGLCIGSGIPQPALFLVDDSAPKARGSVRHAKG